MRGFLGSATELLRTIDFATVIEIGCGPGDLASSLFLNGRPFNGEYCGFDIGESEIKAAKKRFPRLEFELGSAYEIPVQDGAAELVVACEVIEHLEFPIDAIREMARVTQRWVLISVPWEPIWRALNILRGKYMMDFGNTPGHLQHFSRTGIIRLVEHEFSIREVRYPFPWTMILAEKNDTICGK